MKKIIGIILVTSTLIGCETVDSGHRGVEVSWGGKTNTEKVYEEGVHFGFNWLFDNMVNYDVREKTMVETFTFNDKNNMNTKVELSLDYKLNPNKVNHLHKEITDVEVKIAKTLKSAGKEVVPQYSAVELNITKRSEAESKLSEIISKELPEFYVEFARIQMTDVDIPQAVAQLAEETAVQIGRNELASKKEAEQSSLAKARVAEAKGKFEAAEYEAKAKAILSKPEMLALKKLEVEMEWAKKGISPYGTHNVFGAGTTILKSIK